MQIPQYNQQTTANLVGNIAPAPNVTITNPAAQQLGGLGQGLEQLSDAGNQSHAINKMIDTQEQYQTSITTAAAASSQAQLDWTKTMEQRQNAATGNAAGFTDSTLQDFDKYSANMISQYEDPVAKKLVSHEMAGLRTQIGMQALSFQQKMTVNNKLNNINDLVTNNSQLLNTDQSQYAKYKAITNATIDNSGLDEITREKLKQQAQQTYIDSANKSILVTNPQKGVAMLQPSVGQGLTGDEANIAKMSTDPVYNLAVIGMESGGSSNPTSAQSKTSTAYGLSQMTAATRAQYGLTKNSTPEEQITALNKFTSDNKSQLTGNLGRQPTYQELYLAHHFGASGATKLIQGDPAAPISSVLSSAAIKANPELKGKTIGDVVTSNSNMFNAKAQGYINQQQSAANSNPVVADMNGEQRAQWLEKFQSAANTQQHMIAINLQSTVNDQIAKASVGRTDFTPLQAADFSAMYPDDGTKATEAYNNYTATLQLGKDINQVNGMNAQQEQDMINSYSKVTQTGTDTSGAITRQQQLMQAIGAKHKQLNEDPAGWALANSDTVQHAFQAGGTHAGYQAMIAEQQRQGVVQPQILTKDDVAKNVAMINQAKGSDRATVIRGMETQYGDYWNVASAQMQTDKNMPDGVAAIMTAPDPVSMERAANLSSVQLNDLKKLIPSNVKGSDIDTAVSTNLDNFKSSFPTYALGDKSIKDVMTNVEKAAYDNARGGQSADDAATSAVNQFINAKYNFANNNGYAIRVPKNYDINIINTRLNNIQSNLGINDIDTSNAHLLKSVWTMRDDASGYLNQVNSTGFWLTNNNEDGASLYFTGNNNIMYPVLDKSGKQISKNFNDLNYGNNASGAK